MCLHVGAQDGIDAGLIAGFLAEPAQQVGIESHGYHFFRRRQHHLGRFPGCGIRGVRVEISCDPFTDRSRRTASQARPVGPAAGFREIRGQTERSPFSFREFRKMGYVPCIPNSVQAPPRGP